jgi:hypothetical protein
MPSTYRRPVQAVIGLSGIPSHWGDLPTTLERFTRLDLPAAVGPEHVASLRSECERFADAAGRHPETMAALQNAVLQGDQQAADQAIDKLDLRPPPVADFIAGELAVAGGILIILLAVALSSDSGTDSKEPVGPEGGVPRKNAGDAGDAGAR